MKTTRKRYSADFKAKVALGGDPGRPGAGGDYLHAFEAGSELRAGFGQWIA